MKLSAAEWQGGVIGTAGDPEGARILSRFATFESCIIISPAPRTSTTIFSATLEHPGQPDPPQLLLCPLGYRNLTLPEPHLDEASARCTQNTGKHRIEQDHHFKSQITNHKQPETSTSREAHFYTIPTQCPPPVARASGVGYRLTLRPSRVKYERGN